MNVKFAESSNSPLVPASTTLPLVKSSIFADARVDCPSTSNVPLVCVLPLLLCTVNFSSPMFNSVSVNTKSTLSSNSPLVPAITTLSFVKSFTIADCKYASFPTEISCEALTPPVIPT